MRSSILRSTLALGLVMTAGFGTVPALARRPPSPKSAGTFAFPAEIEKTMLHGMTVGKQLETLKPYLSDEDYAAAVVAVGADAQTRLPLGQKDGSTYIFRDGAKEVRMIFDFKESRSFKINAEVFEIQDGEKLADAIKRFRVQAQAMKVADNFRSPLQILLMPEAQAVIPVVYGMLAVSGSVAYYAYDRYTSMQTTCGELNTAVRACSAPLRKLAEMVTKCRKDSKPELEKDLKRAEAKVKREENKKPQDLTALTQAQLDLGNLKRGMADLSNDANTAKCKPNAEQKESDAFTTAVGEAETTFHDVVAKLENRDTRYSMSLMCNNYRETLRNCRDRIHKASNILDLDITRDRTANEPGAPASPNGARQ